MRVSEYRKNSRFRRMWGRVSSVMDMLSWKGQFYIEVEIFYTLSKI